MKVSLKGVQKHLKWLKQKIYLDSISSNAAGRQVRRGEVFYCDLGRGIGNEEQKNRPSVIIQNNTGNINSPNTIVAPITNTSGPSIVTVEINNKNDLDYDRENLQGYILLGNIVTVSKARLGDHIATLKKEKIEEVNERILASLGLFGKFKDMRETIQKDKAYISKANDKISQVKRIIQEFKEEIPKKCYQEIADTIDI